MCKKCHFKAKECSPRSSLHSFCTLNTEALDFLSLMFSTQIAVDFEMNCVTAVCFQTSCTYSYQQGTKGWAHAHVACSCAVMKDRQIKLHWKLIFQWLSLGL